MAATAKKKKKKEIYALQTQTPANSASAAEKNPRGNTELNFCMSGSHNEKRNFLSNLTSTVRHLATLPFE